MLAIFLQFFGLPAIEKYGRKDVLWVETIKDTDGIALPAITLRFGSDASEIQQYISCYSLNVSITQCLETSAPNLSTILMILHALSPEDPKDKILSTQNVEINL